MRPPPAAARLLLALLLRRSGADDAGSGSWSADLVDDAAVLCTAPADMTGYSDVVERSLAARSFDIRASCARHYEGNATVLPCTDGAAYALTGCRHADEPECSHCTHGTTVSNRKCFGGYVGFVQLPAGRGLGARGQPDLRKLCDGYTRAPSGVEACADGYSECSVGTPTACPICGGGAQDYCRCFNHSDVASPEGVASHVDRWEFSGRCSAAPELDCSSCCTMACPVPSADEATGECTDQAPVWGQPPGGELTLYPNSCALESECAQQARAPDHCDLSAVHAKVGHASVVAVVADTCNETLSRCDAGAEVRISCQQGYASYYVNTGGSDDDALPSTANTWTLRCSKRDADVTSADRGKWLHEPSSWPHPFKDTDTGRLGKCEPFCRGCDKNKGSCFRMEQRGLLGGEEHGQQLQQNCGGCESVNPQSCANTPSFCAACTGVGDYCHCNAVTAGVDRASVRANCSISGEPCGSQCCNEAKHCSLPMPATACEDKQPQCYFGQDLSSHVDRDSTMHLEQAIYSSDSVDIGELFDSQCHADAECVDRQDTIPQAAYDRRMLNLTCDVESVRNDSWVCAGKTQKHWHCGRCEAHAAIPCLVDNDVLPWTAYELCDGQGKKEDGPFCTPRSAPAAAAAGAAPTGGLRHHDPTQQAFPPPPPERSFLAPMIAGWVVVAVCCVVVFSMFLCRSKKPKTRDRGGGSRARGLLELVSPRTREYP